jgi:acetyl-CoA carboxylase biotin carboxyl carrier protein
MIDIRKLKELVRLMVNADLTELDLRDGQEQVTLKRNQPGAMVAGPQVVYAAPPMAAIAPAAAPMAASAPSGGGAASAPATEDAGLVAIESPMVGTFYSASSPDKPPFATVGMSVGPETVVCLIEAMKIFNEIKAERAGTIERVLVKNGQPVEFGQRLFLVRPS